MLPTVKPIKGWTGTKSSPLNIRSVSLNSSCKKGLTSKNAEYLYSKCKNEEIVGSEQVYEHKSDDILQVDLQLNPYECAMLNDFELCNVHAESAEISRWSLLNSKIDLC